MHSLSKHTAEQDAEAVIEGEAAASDDVQARQEGPDGISGPGDVFSPAAKDAAETLTRVLHDREHAEQKQAEPYSSEDPSPFLARLHELWQGTGEEGVSHCLQCFVRPAVLVVSWRLVMGGKPQRHLCVNQILEEVNEVPISVRKDQTSVDVQAVPRFNRKELDLERLWFAVHDCGGYQEVGCWRVQGWKRLACVNFICSDQYSSIDETCVLQVCDGKLWARIGRQFDPPKYVLACTCARASSTRGACTQRGLCSADP